MNEVWLSGRLGHAPSLRYTQSGIAVCTFSLATTERWKDQSGEKQERREWHQVQAWRRAGEVIAEHFEKGSWISLTGRIHYETVEKEGKKTYYTKIVVDKFEFTGGSKREGGNTQEPKAEGSPEQPPQDQPPDLPF